MVVVALEEDEIAVIAVKKHELQALHDLVLNVRAISTSMFTKGDDYAHKLKSLCQQVEDFASRIETEKARSL